MPQYVIPDSVNSDVPSVTTAVALSLQSDINQVVANEAEDVWVTIHLRGDALFQPNNTTNHDPVFVNPSLACVIVLDNS